MATIPPRRAPSPRTFSAAAVAALLLVGCSVHGAWDLFRILDPDAWYSASWRYRHRLFFDNAGQAEDLSDFPVLVVLTPSRVDYGLMKPDGSDIRFVDARSGADLSHEIEAWNPGGTSYLWVRVPRIDGGSDLDSIYLYYGNPAAASAEDPPGVWDAGFRGVWHLHDDFDDSTAYANHGANNGSVHSPGRIGDGQDFDGSTAFVRIGDDPTLRITGGLTLEAWAHKRAVGSQAVVAKHRSPGNQRSYRMGFDHPLEPNGPYLSLSDTGSWVPEGLLAHPSGTLNNWRYVAAAYDRASIRLHLNGLLVAQRSTTVASVYANVEHVIIGAVQNGMADWFDGVIDEVRISATPRSPDWIAAQHLSMTDAFLYYGPLETE